MMENQELHSTADFSEKWQFWLVLAHLLPLGMQRELLDAAVNELSDGRFSTKEIFEEDYRSSSIWNESLMLRCKEDLTRDQAAVQRWISALVWRNDDVRIFEVSALEGRARDVGKLIDVSSVIALADLRWDDVLPSILNVSADQLQPSLRVLVSAITAAIGVRKDGTQSWDLVVSTLAEVGMPERALSIKHIADLFADDDDWHMALDGYVHAASLLKEWKVPSDLRHLQMAWTGILEQSCATARIFVGPRSEGVAMMHAVAESGDFDGNVLRWANAARDSVRLRTINNFVDEMPRIAVAPMLIASHDLDAAHDYWARRKYPDARRRFYAVLRRQVALGAYSDVQHTKAAFALMALEHITDDLRLADGNKNFYQAVKWLMESEQADRVEHIRWTVPLVDMFVTDVAQIDALSSHASAYDGARIGRAKVFVEIMRSWIQVVEPSRKDLIVHMWKEVAKVAHNYKANFETAIDGGRPALKALGELAKKRPEYRALVVTNVVDAVCAKLREESRWGRVEAVEAVLEYLGAWDDEPIRLVVTATLEALNAEDPARHFWPFIRPATSLLTHGAVRRALVKNDSMSKDCVEQLFRFGLGSESEYSELLFNLAAFDDTLLDRDDVRSQLTKVLDLVRADAHHLNSSAVTRDIQALLVSPRLSGKPGIGDALDAIAEVLESAQADRTSLGLAYIDGPLFLLIDRLPIVRKMFDEDPVTLEGKLRRIDAALGELWTVAASKPQLFAPFSIPRRSKPNEVLVHNCAFASIRLVEAVGQQSVVLAAIHGARANAELRAPIELAVATNASRPQAAHSGTIDDLSSERRSFYQSLGRRLSQVLRLTPSEASSYCQRMLDICFDVGPHAADGSVFVLAQNLDVDWADDERKVMDYRGRVEQDRELRLLLLPLLDSHRAKHA